jgi:hypothetical protein
MRKFIISHQCQQAERGCGASAAICVWVRYTIRTHLMITSDYESLKNMSDFLLFELTNQLRLTALFIIANSNKLYNCNYELCELLLSIVDCG